ncbi:uncharacterized protein [Mytilus edulis]|uniref:uncharacterized protein isoform X3 n=1 Tax=Mytilus edulis TaxID=6550 RepID=UPI0039F0D678
MDESWIPDITVSTPEIQVLTVIPLEGIQKVEDQSVIQPSENEQANMDQNWAKKMNIANKERENVARIVWLLMDAGTFALRSTFDSVHPPLNLREHLSQAHIKAVLQRLHTSNVINDKLWEMLYPLNKKNTSSQQYDSRALCILLQSICHLCPPYPNGWGVAPLPTDSSLSADIVRLQLLHQKVARMDMISPEEFVALWNQIKEVLVRLGGPPIRVRLHRIEHEMITTELQNHYVNLFQDQWADGRKLVMTPKSTGSRKRGRSMKNKKEENGIPKEDKAVLLKTYRMFVDNVQAEDILDRLQQNQVLKFSERQEILAISKNSERMQTIIEKIHTTKLSFGFKALCDSIKFKYKKLYDVVMAIRKEVYKHGIKDTVGVYIPDVVGVCRDSLYQTYKAMFAKCHPFSWADNISVNIRDLYTPLDILDSNGRKLHLSDILPPPCTNGKGQRIVLEGAGGSGKSILCAMITQLWASHKNYFKYTYNILIHVDIATIKGDFKTEVYHRLFPDDFKIKQKDFWATMEENSHEIVLLIDSYEGKTEMRDLQDIISGTSLPQATVIVATNPDTSHSLGFSADSKLFNMGYSSHSVARCFKTYLYHFKAHPDKHQALFDLIENESWVMHKHLAQPIVCLLIFAIYQTNKTANLDDIDCITNLFEVFGLSMATHYCKRQKIDVIGYEFPEEIVSAINELSNFAFESLRDGKRAYLEDEIVTPSNNSMIFHLGVFFRLNGPHWKFTCTLMQDFLAARHLSDFVLEEMSTILKDNKMMKYSRYSQMITLLCGLFRDDYDTSTLKSLFTDLAMRNISNTKVLGDDVQSVRSADSRASISHAPSGKLVDYNISLQSLTECDYREDMCEIVAQSLPAKMIIKRDGLISTKTLEALPLVMTVEANRITYLDLVLQPSYSSQAAVYTEFAKGVAKTGCIKHLKIHWSTLDLMARILDAFMTTVVSVESIVLSDICKKSIKHVSADTWATLQNACENMTKTKEFAFLNGSKAAIAYFVLQHLPTTIQDLNFTGCKLNMMCASELSYKLEHANSLTKLDITNTQLAGSDFVAVLQGLKICPTIKHLKLCGAKLDRPGVITLSECLRLTRTLQILDLSNCELDTEMSKLLANAIADNRSLMKLVLKNTKVTLEGKNVISHTKFVQLKVIGLEDAKHLLLSI